MLTPVSVDAIASEISAAHDTCRSSLGVSICTFVPVTASKQLLGRRYLCFCTSKASKVGHERRRRHTCRSFLVILPFGRGIESETTTYSMSEASIFRSALPENTPAAPSASVFPYFW